MAITESIIFYLGLLFAIPLAFGLGWLLGKLFKARWLAFALPAALGLGVVLGGPAYIQQRGVATSASIASKEERIQVARDGLFTRYYFLTLQYLPAGQSDSVTAGISVTRDRYDRLRDSSRVDIRYLSQFPGFMRVTGAGTFDWLPESQRLGFVVPVVILLFAPVIVCMWALRADRGSRTPGFRVFALAWLVCLALVVVRSLTPASPPALDTEATARVADVTRITKGPFSGARLRFEAARPFDVVRLELTPTGSRTAVVAMDAVDAGSVAGLTPGATLPVHYASADPRSARLTAAERSFHRPNMIRFWTYLSLYFIPAALCIVVLTLRLGRRAGSPRDTVPPHSPPRP